MVERHGSGVLDTCAYIDLGGPGGAAGGSRADRDHLGRAASGGCHGEGRCGASCQTEKLGAAIVEFEPLPFDGQAAARFGTLVALTLEANRDPRPRRLDLMIAAIASARGLPLYTRNAEDFVGLDDLVEIVEV